MKHAKNICVVDSEREKPKKKPLMRESVTVNNLQGYNRLQNHSIKMK